ncbi:glycosyltransferase family 2 protein (plasmid) [Paracoccus stylophorae]|uniref:Glycosyltransferase family 2 protein n=1 Tax=Paracoccus stylophorae TaxID=659350 RepID=A0ABY7T072_9RHOB|nr:glycosyltransferase family A protein [Paracoccus stylophorae]WCR12691.1 glycosyltransferase family 2 protein [Paracoccus stylophorae]
MMTSPQTVSVIMPARNAERTIEKSVASVLAQRGLGELIVVDDGSTDRTRDVLDRISDRRIRIIQGPGAGIARALNAGLFEARFAYVARCDSDDLYPADRLARQSTWLDANPEFIGISGGFVTIDEAGKKLASLVSDGEAREVTNDLREGNVLTSLCTWLIRRNSICSIGGVRPWFETAEDVDLQFRLAGIGRIWHDPEPTYFYRLHHQSITHTRQSARLHFFDDMAVKFNHQRMTHGRDDLDIGAAPAVPEFSDCNNMKHTVLRRQVVGHLTAQAWRDFHGGRKLDGIAGLCSAIRRHPTSLACWRGLAVMILRAAQSKK